MQLPEVEISHLENIDDSTLTSLCEAITVIREQATNEEELGGWEIALAILEIELWSRGYKPKQKQ